MNMRSIFPARLTRSPWLALLALCACSSGLGPAGGYLVQDGKNIPSAGVKLTSIVDLAPQGGPGFAAGFEGQAMQRIGQGGDEWGQWQLMALSGFSHLPRPEQTFIGYEAFATSGVARTYVGVKPSFRFAMGTELGLPLRLAAPQPIWRADDLVGLGVYLVPSVAATWFAGDTLALSASLTLRVTLWSAITP
jgi:hypothetical protein